MTDQEDFFEHFYGAPRLGGRASSGSPAIKIKKLTPTAIMPMKATAGATCFDVSADPAYGEIVVDLGCVTTVSTGLAFEIPEGWEMVVYSRSGHASKHNIRLANSVGKIDNDYRGELLVMLTRGYSVERSELIRELSAWILGEVEAEGDPVKFKPGSRIAQIEFRPTYSVRLELVDELSETRRGSGGLGSTGDG
jgi:dUTP pyrophosphatase